MNPLLYDHGMLIHPPMLLLGIPVSRALCIRDGCPAFLAAPTLSGSRPAVATRCSPGHSSAPATCWGAWWAYHVLGWGGYWGWDPVDNSAIMPWLALTAFVHSIMVQQRRGMLKVWNMALIHRHVLSRGAGHVHRAQRGHLVGPLVRTIGDRAVLLRVSRGRDRVRYRAGGPTSASPRRRKVRWRRFTRVRFLPNNVLLISIAFATYWGTVFPVLSEAARGVKATVRRSLLSAGEWPAPPRPARADGRGAAVAMEARQQRDVPARLSSFHWPWPCCCHDSRP